MHIDHQLAGKLSGILATIGFIPYLIAIIQRKMTASKASWIIWAVVGTALALSYKTAGAKASMWVPISYAVCPLVVLAAIFWKDRSREKWPKEDIVCLIIGLALFIPWSAFKVIEYLDMMPSWGIVLPRITLYGGIAVDTFGAIPTVWKSWKNPKSESFWGWTFWVAGNLLNLLAVESWVPDVASYAIYIATPCVFIWPALFMYRIKSRKI